MIYFPIIKRKEFLKILVFTKKVLLHVLKSGKLISIVKMIHLSIPALATWKHKKRHVLASRLVKLIYLISHLISFTSLRSFLVKTLDSICRHHNRRSKVGVQSMKSDKRGREAQLMIGNQWIWNIRNDQQNRVGLPVLRYILNLPRHRTKSVGERWVKWRVWRRHARKVRPPCA